MTNDAHTTRDAAIAQVNENSTPEERAALMAAIRTVAQRRPTFTTDDVWDACEVKPREPRLLGATMRDACKRGIVEPVTMQPTHESTQKWFVYVASGRRSSHARHKQLWASKHT